MTGEIWVFKLSPLGHSPRNLTLLTSMHVGQPMDNLEVDANGAIWAAAFPKVRKLLQGFDAPRSRTPPSAAFKIEPRGLPAATAHAQTVPAYHVTKVLEDRDADMLPGSTTVLHDAKTGRLFFGGVFSPFVTVCERTKV